MQNLTCYEILICTHINIPEMQALRISCQYHQLESKIFFSVIVCQSLFICIVLIKWTHYLAI